MARLRGFQKLTSIGKSWEKFLAWLQPQRLDTVFLPLQEIRGRVIANHVRVERDLPSFNRSAVDGYALRAQDIDGASQLHPKILRLVKKNFVKEGETTEIWTGNALPKGANAVVMLEHVRKTGREIEISKPLTPGANFSKQGEDLKKGEIAVKAGTRLRPHHIGLLAASGLRRVEVVRKPRVAILATGNEVVALGSEPEPNKIIDANTIMLSGMCSELGAEAFSLGISRDSEKEIESKIKEGLKKADLIITTGGTSVGLHDLIPEVIKNIAPHGIVVHGIAMRPGMPTALAVLEKKPVIICSGNPVAALIGFEVFARPLIQKMLGVKNEERHRLRARLTRRVAGVLGRAVFLRVKVRVKEGELWAEPIRAKGSGIITTVTRANGYVIIPTDREGLGEKEWVEVHLFDYVQWRR